MKLQYHASSRFLKALGKTFSKSFANSRIQLHGSLATHFIQRADAIFDVRVNCPDRYFKFLINITHFNVTKNGAKQFSANCRYLIHYLIYWTC